MVSSCQTNSSDIQIKYSPEFTVCKQTSYPQWFHIIQENWGLMVYVEAITFDLWQILIIDNRELGRARTHKRLEDTSSCLNSAGYDFTADHLLEAYRNCYRTTYITIQKHT